MKALHFGAGNIGRGFIGLVLYKSGYEVVFADVVKDLIDRLNKEKSYRVHVLGEEVDIEKVNGVRGVMIDSDECIKEIVTSNLITTAVGVNHLDGVAKVLVEGIRRMTAAGRNETLNILACENALYATDILKAKVLELLSEEEREYAYRYIGFANVAVDRISPNFRSDDMGPLDAATEKFFEWDIEKGNLKTELKIDGVNLVENLGPFLERKLFMLNGAHAMTAYLGYLKGYKTIDEAITDEEILSTVKKAQEEMAHGLAQKYNTFTIEELIEYSEKIIERFKNRFLHDEITRVGREPLRKLAPNDRLITPLRLCIERGKMPEAIIKGIAAAYRFDYEGDGQAVEMQRIIREKGIAGAVEEISGLPKDSYITAKIVVEYNKLVK
ncbi:MAG: mannitol-1-phosphate 5-dehydrogenase [Thermoanaerobacteraceae bacterium]|nr:mannitol-1-phosphate 5-dehydrogenase [Thermoanaerobacteraceae bacterium]